MAVRLIKESLYDIDPSYVYHGTSKDKVLNILIEGFKGSSVFLANSKEVASGYGPILIKLKKSDIESKLKIIDLGINPNTSLIHDEIVPNCDGIRYRFFEDDPYNYKIYSVNKLNTVDRSIC